ncbi:MAG: signal peptidase I [Clostridia bacterium]|nr:signal peptidase I [Clostridia bacterium]
MEHNSKKENNAGNKALTIIGIVLCVILVPMLIVNCTLIIKSYVNTEEVPTFGGFCPMIVLTDSMNSQTEDPRISKGDLIICKQTDAENVQVGDVISFFDPEGNGTSVVTHKVIEVFTEDGELFFRTKGTNNNTEDKTPVPAENLVGVYKLRIPFAGHVAIFLQTTPGLIVCIVLPIVLFVAYELIRRRKFDKAKQEDTDALLKELAALRAEKEQKEKASEGTPEDSTN